MIKKYINNIIRKRKIKGIIKGLHLSHDANENCIEGLRHIIVITEEQPELAEAMSTIIDEIKNTIYIGERVGVRFQQLINSLENDEYRFIQTQMNVLQKEQSDFDEKIHTLNAKIQLIKYLITKNANKTEPANQ